MNALQKLASLSKKKTRIAAGIMSGTSLDGVDIVLLKIKGSGRKTKIEQIAFSSKPFPGEMKSFLKKNAELYGGNVTDLCRINFLLARVYANELMKLCASANIPLNEVDFIGCHGQTMHHLPDKHELFGLPAQSTLQLGDPAVLAKLTGILTIGDFRTGDVALGGQGAPLVPYFDYLMYTSRTKNRMLLNIGGISNVTVLPANAAPEDVIAFDTGPGNMIVDSLMSVFFQKDLDTDGKIASKGLVSQKILTEIASHDHFFRAKPPKSSGREYYGKEFTGRILTRYHNTPREDLIATATAYTAYTVYQNYINFIRPKTEITELYVSGGGAHNKTMMKFLREYFGASVKVNNVEKLGISSDAKEAICFAVLANETLSGNPANLTQVTGASARTILGKICLP